MFEGLYNRTAYITQISKDYVCCFSEEKDLLSQWRGYGSDGNGIAIGFNAQLLRKLDINGSRYKFIKVIYDNEKVYENIRSYMEKQMITILDDIKEEELDPENILFNLVTVIAPMMEDNYIFKNRLLHNHTYSCISQMRRYRSNLQALFLVHPAAFIQVAVDQKQEYNC